MSPRFIQTHIIYLQENKLTWSVWKKQRSIFTFKDKRTSRKGERVHEKNKWIADGWITTPGNFDASIVKKWDHRSATCGSLKAKKKGGQRSTSTMEWNQVAKHNLQRLDVAIEGTGFRDDLSASLRVGVGFCKQTSVWACSQTTHLIYFGPWVLRLKYT